ncbi:adrenodoxin [Colossoma macropomum]|uniref:adrenodoxin n=1 Tax=Colossoma macropomum TaxID=42526 RepID=UPI00186526AA|nr:adrenodoxin [Colossoma macropomum]
MQRPSHFFTLPLSNFPLQWSVSAMSASPLSSRLLLLGLTAARATTCGRFRQPGCIFSNARGVSSGPALRAEERATIHFVNRDGKRISVNTLTGVSLLDVVVNKNLDFEGFGACEGTLACSTCHLIFEEKVYNKLMADTSISDEEMDMLDLAYGLTPTSRLGCQVCVSKLLDGMVVRVPEAVTDARKTNDKDSAP